MTRWPRPIPPFSARAVRRFIMFSLAAVIVLAGGRGAALHAQTQSTPLLLAPGWNNFAYVGPAQPVLAALAPIAGQYDALWTFDATGQTWQSFNPRAPESSDFADFSQGTAYWIHMLQAAVLQIGTVGTVPNQRHPLVNGWNNVAQVEGSAPVADALAPYNATYAVIWHWNAAAQRWELYDPQAPQISEFSALTQGQSYFVQVTAASPIPAAPVATACYGYQSYQPQMAEALDALNKAGGNALAGDPAFRLPDLHTAPDDGSATVPAYIPPTVLKSIAWIESGVRQATYSVPRGDRGATITSRTCAYGLMQVLTGMQVSGAPTPRQVLIGTDYLHNISAGAQILVGKWNMAPRSLPIYGRRDPHIIEDWYFALWAYHCFGDVCARYNVHNNPDDPALKWPRPGYGSPEQQNSRGAFSASDYPYQEIIFGQIANPPVRDGAPVWQAVPAQLPPHGTIGFPVPQSVIEASAHLEGGQALTVPTPAPTPQPSPGATPAAGRTPTPFPALAGTYFPPVGP